MLYTAYELAYAAVAPARAAAGIGARFWRSPLNPAAESWAGRSTAAAFDIFENAMRRYTKPQWGAMTTRVNDVEIPVSIETADAKDFCRLLHFKRDEASLKKAGRRGDDPKILIIAPLSGHFATLLRDTVEAMLPGHDVYLTDWSDARFVPVSNGRFDLNDSIDYLIDFLRRIGARAPAGAAHAMAVCQPGPALLAAASIMAEDADPHRPASMTLMGSPIDTRKSPTVPNLMAQERDYAWFENNMIYTVPVLYPGAFRRVYPGFVQLYSFLSMNTDRHISAHYDYFQHLVEGDGDSAEKHRSFYDEYLSVLDLTEEFYLQTVREIFQEHSLPEGKFMHRGKRVRLEAIEDIALMTIEGENDDISGIGQTQAAHDLCVNIPDALQTDYVQPNVGHYGVFNGSRWRHEIQPRIAKFIKMAERAAPARAVAALAAE